jgi:DNA-binding transcriptional ArsR family regulator
LAGLVKTRREGTFVYYSPADQDILRILSQALLGTDTISHETGAAEKG